MTAHSVPYRVSPAAVGAWVRLAELLADVGPVPCEVSDPGAWFSTNPNVASMAVRACHSCAAELECLAYAVAAGERNGVWGGRVFDSYLAGRLEAVSS